MSSLTYAGEPLLYDHGGVVQKFLDTNQEFDDLRDVTSPLMVRADGLSLPNYTLPPRIRLNQLYWPTGASRWAIGYFLADKESKDQIVANVLASDGTNVASTLVVSLGERPEPNTQFADFDMYLLPPREITGNYAGDEKTLWLLILVDDRYWWQFDNMGGLEVEEGDSNWNEVIFYFEGAGGLGDRRFADVSSEPSSAISADYLGPDPKEVTRLYDNTALMYDSAVLSVGHRVVADYGGRTHHESPTDAAIIRTSNEAGTSAIFGGNAPIDGILAGQSDIEVKGVAESVDVVFPALVDHVPITQKARVYNKTPSGEATTQNTVKTIHSTAYADFTINGTGAPESTPDNDAALDTLATKIAADYYAWLAPAYDKTYPGIRPWVPCGYDNYILFQFGGEERFPELSATTQVKLRGDDEDDTESVTSIEKTFERRFWTRVVSMPPNFGVEYQLSQDSTLTVLKPFQFGKLDEDLLTADATATVSVWDADDPTDRTDDSHSVTSDNIEVYNFTTLPLVSGSPVFCWFDYESERWYAISVEAGIIRFELTSAMTIVNTNADAERINESGTKDGVTISVADVVGNWAGAIGNQGWAVKMSDRPTIGGVDAYDILFLEAQARFIEFTLTENMGNTQADEARNTTVTGGTTAFWGDSPNGITPGATVTVFDRQAGAGGPQLFEHALSGAKGLAIWNEQDEEYVIVRCETKARFIRFALTQAMATTDATRTATKQDFWDGQDPGVITSVENFDASANKAFTGASGDMGIARLDEIDNVYRIVAMEDPVNGDGLGAAGVDVWITYVKAGNKLVHNQPFTDTDQANPALTHENNGAVASTLCGIQVDDAGHVMGWLDASAGWESPWGFGSPF